MISDGVLIIGDHKFIFFCFYLVHRFDITSLNSSYKKIYHTPSNTRRVLYIFKKGLQVRLLMEFTLRVLYQRRSCILLKNLYPLLVLGYNKQANGIGSCIRDGLLLMKPCFMGGSIIGGRPSIGASTVDLFSDCTEAQMRYCKKKFGQIFFRLWLF